MEETLILTGGRVAFSTTDSVQMDLEIRRGCAFYLRSGARGRVLDLSGYLILPGLINTHDHLELNLLPRLGNGPYRNATQWALDIYRPSEPPVKQHLAVPKPLRLLWGGIKNLLSGVTTVGHHNPYCPEVFGNGFPVRVVRRMSWAHSIRFSPDWRSRYLQRRKNAPFIIHAGEGTDEEAKNELEILECSEALGPTTVIVHGVAFSREEIALMEKRKASLVWCPSSNLFTLGRTVDPQVFKSRIPIALGTDAAITAAGDMYDELSIASGMVSPARLYGMVTSEAAAVLKLPSTYGSIQNGASADLVVLRDIGASPADTLLRAHPEMVIAGGRIRLLSLDMATHLRLTGNPRLQPIDVENRGRYLLPLDVHALFQETKQVLGQEIRLAGKAVAA
ncbi:MAG TPA: amidohydrolase family protein [Bryobacteraceae bacterium]|jgi:cytosine/adenosine deaminase-related metal-dependent hydrolase|nr:amidohydrolase family protein [Bryobacteraceae bacterium]